MIVEDCLIKHVLSESALPLNPRLRGQQATNQPVPGAKLELAELTRRGNQSNARRVFSTAKPRSRVRSIFPSRLELHTNPTTTKPNRLQPAHNPLVLYSCRPPTTQRQFHNPKLSQNTPHIFSESSSVTANTYWAELPRFGN